ncbi:MAG: T9SS type A sorting domain-containing protein [Bacteroidota bacterium]
MKKTSIILVMFLANISQNFAQFYNKGAQIVVQNGIALKIDGDFYNEINSNFKNDSKVIIKGNVTNNQTMEAPSTGLWEFSGSSSQNIQGNSPLFVFDIKFDNIEGFELNNSIKIFGQANFANGLVNTFYSSPLVFGPNGTIPAPPADASHVVGPVVKEGTAPFIFPVGNTDKFQPVLAEFTQNANGLLANYVAGDAGPGNFTNGGTDAIPLNSYNSGEYWDILPVNEGITSAFITLFWNGYNDASPTDLGFRRVAHKVGTNWLNEGSTGTTGDISAGTVRSNLINTWSPFTLGFVQSAPLPLSLLNFTAKKAFSGNQLSWQTANEVGTSHFEIEKSDNGKSFEKIGQIKANGGPSENAKYEFLDTQTNPKAWDFYRLKMIDLGGKYSFSKIISIKNNNTNSSIKLYPNPAISELNIENMEGNSVEVININGQKKIYNALKKNEIQSSIDVSDLPKGLYFLKAGNEVGKFLKQ